LPVLEVVNQQNELVGEVALDDAIFDGRVREHLIHEVVVMQLATRRAGSSSAKTRSEVKGSRSKPWRQKGTGRARAGRRQSPLWRHGGVIFPPKPRNYGFRPPKKVRQAALVSALNRKILEGNVKVVSSLQLPQPETSEMRRLLGNLELEGQVLCVTAGPDPELRRASWNLQQTKSLPAIGVNVYDVERANVLLISRDGVEAVQQRFRPPSGGASEIPSGETPPAEEVAPQADGSDSAAPASGDAPGEEGED
jgi:large subunit ribosomal protein L4